MTCTACAVVRQYAYNWLLLADLALNTALAGQPSETVSQRTARARAAGSKAAAVFCRVLTACSNVLGNHGDHCTWALAEQAADADEIWHWTGSTSNAAATSAMPVERPELAESWHWSNKA